MIIGDIITIFRGAIGDMMVPIGAILYVIAVIMRVVTLGISEDEVKKADKALGTKGKLKEEK